MADIGLKDRAGHTDKYSNVDRVIIKKYKEQESDPDEFIVYSLEGTAYDYSYTIRSVNS